MEMQNIKQNGNEWTSSTFQSVIYNCIQTLHLGRFIIGYMVGRMVGNLALQ